MFVVKRAFKSVNKVYAVGSIIEDPTTIRLFKSKVNEGKIVAVNEQNINHIAEYIYNRVGIDIKKALVKDKPVINEYEPAKKAKPVKATVK